jgi:predicted PurR-regulated permease PerM
MRMKSVNIVQKETPVEPVLPADEVVSLPLPLNSRTFFSGGIFVILLFASLKMTSAISLPIVVAFVLRLVLHPVARFLERIRVPRMFASLLILVTLLAGLGVIGMWIIAPASDWVEKMPRGIARIQNNLGFISSSLDGAKEIMSKAEDLTNGENPVPVAVQGSRLSDKVFVGAQAFVSGVFMTALVLFFLLVSGDTFLRKLVEALPRFKDKRKVVDLTLQIEQNVSAYLLTITFMNALIGVATGLIMWAFGIPNPLLWGTVAFLLNYIPIMGPIIMLTIILFVALITTNSLNAALMPMAAYLFIRTTEGSVITPMLVAKQFTLNPVLVIVSIFFWYWMWGIPGAILAMPILAVLKITCDRIERFAPLGHFLGG